MASKKKTKKKQLQIDSEKLMLAYLCIANEAEASLEGKIFILDRFGLSTAEIARVCGVGVQSVLNARVVLKKSKNASSKKS